MSGTDLVPRVFDYSGWSVIVAGDTIVSATITITPSGPIQSGFTQISTPYVQITVSGNNALPGDYVATCVATTAGGYALTDEAPLMVLA